MGLFSRKKKVDACIAFIGFCGSSSLYGDSRRVALLYGPQIRRLVDDKCGGRPFIIRNSDSWTRNRYSRSVIQSVEKNGFSAFDTGDKKKLFDELSKTLFMEYNVGFRKLDLSPVCLCDGEIFVILCRVPVSEEILQA